MMSLINKAVLFFIMKVRFLKVSGVYKYSTVKVKVHSMPNHEQYERMEGLEVKAPVVVQYDKNGMMDKVTICINTMYEFCDTYQETEIMLMDLARRLDEELFSLSECV